MKYDCESFPEALHRLKQSFQRATVDLTAVLQDASEADKEDIQFTIGMSALNAQQIDDFFDNPNGFSAEFVDRFIVDAEKFESELLRHGFGRSQVEEVNHV